MSNVIFFCYRSPSPAHFINGGVINALARRYFYTDAWDTEQPLTNTEIKHYMWRISLNSCERAVLFNVNIKRFQCKYYASEVQGNVSLKCPYYGSAHNWYLYWFTITFEGWMVELFLGSRAFLSFVTSVVLINAHWVLLCSVTQQHEEL